MDAFLCGMKLQISKLCKYAQSYLNLQSWDLFKIKKKKGQTPAVILTECLNKMNNWFSHKEETESGTASVTCFN